MTAFADLERGDTVWASDPLSEKGRPLLVLGTPRLPNHGTQLITVLLSTKTYHETALTLRDADYDGDPLGERSHVLPWSLVTLNSPVDVDHYLTRYYSVGKRTGEVEIASPFDARVLQILDRAVVFSAVLEMFVDDLHDITDLSSRLADVYQSLVWDLVAFDEREEVIVEGQQDPVVFDRVPQLFVVGISERAFVSGSVNGPTAPA